MPSLERTDLVAIVPGAPSTGVAQHLDLEILTAFLRGSGFRVLLLDSQLHAKSLAVNLVAAVPGGGMALRPGSRGSRRRQAGAESSRAPAGGSGRLADSGSRSLSWQPAAQWPEGAAQPGL